MRKRRCWRISTPSNRSFCALLIKEELPTVRLSLFSPQLHADSLFTQIFSTCLAFA